MLLAQLLLGFHYFLLSADYVSAMLEVRGIKGVRIYIVDVLGAGRECYPPSTTNCGFAYVLFEIYLTPAVTEYAFSSSGGLFLLLVRYVTGRLALPGFDFRLFHVCRFFT